MRWQRKLNPQLMVGLNNTTQWAGIRYSDFCLLEGGDEVPDFALPWLLQPQGIVNKRHFPLIFGDYSAGIFFKSLVDRIATLIFSLLCVTLSVVHW